MPFDETRPGQVALAEPTPLPAGRHFERASRLLQRCDQMVEALDEHGSWHEDAEAVLQVDLLARLAHAHATLGSSR